MFGHRHKFGGEHPFMHMAGRFGGRGGGFGPFGGHGLRGGPGGPRDMLRAGRMLGDGDLKLITLQLLSQTPRHGYDIIKALEDISSGIYVPSPGVVYPTLTFLEEAGYAVSEMDGTKKVFSITDAGRAHLEESQELVDSVLHNLERFGAKMAKAKEWFGWDDDAADKRGRGGRNPQFRAVRKRLKEALADIVEASAEKQADAIQILENAAEALEALTRR
jgi:DNA-binding PadR family transcriptional regulator